MKIIEISFAQELLDSAPDFDPKELVRSINKKLKGKKLILVKRRKKHVHSRRQDQVARKS